MSRIHDALRLRRVSAGAPHAVRAGQTDAVLSALGYRAEAADDSSPLKPGVALAALAIVVAILAAWYFWQRGSVASLPSTHAPGRRVQNPVAGAATTSDQQACGVECRGSRPSADSGARCESQSTGSVRLHS